MHAELPKLLNMPRGVIRLEQLVCILAGALFLCTGVLKLLAYFGPVSGPPRYDPVLVILNARQVLLLAAVAELTVVAGLIVSKDRVLRMGLIAWPSLIFLCYRWVLWIKRVGGGCPCLGGELTPQLLKAAGMQTIVAFAPYVLLFTSLMFLWLGRHRPSEQRCKVMCGGGACQSGTHLSAMGWMALLLVSLGNVARASEPAVRLEGTVRLTSYKADGTVFVPMSMQYQIRLAGEQWDCRLVFSNHWYEINAFDGTNCYYLLRTPDDATNRHACIPATIRPGPYPLDAFSAMRVLWLGLAGEQFFKAAKEGRIPAPWGHAALAGADSVTCEADWLDAEHRIPQRIQFRFSAPLWQQELQEKNLDPKTTGSPFTNRQLVAELKLLETINALGRVWPGRFELMRYGILRDGRPSVLELHDVTVETIIASGEPPQIPPVLEREAHVLDFRYSNPDVRHLNVRYNLTNGQWKPTNDAALLALAQAARSNYPAYLKALRQRPGVPLAAVNVLGYGALLFVTLGPPILWALWRARKQSDQCNIPVTKNQIPDL